MRDDVTEVKEQSAGRDKAAMDQLMAEMEVKDTPLASQDSPKGKDKAAGTEQTQVQPGTGPGEGGSQASQGSGEASPGPAQQLTESPEPGAQPREKVGEETPGTVSEATDPLKIIESVKLRSDASPKTAESFALVKKHASEAITRATALETQLKEAQDKVKFLEGNQFTPELKQQLEQLQQFQQTFGIDQDPQFNAEFDQAIKAGETQALDMLGSKNWRILPDSAVKYISEHGGVSQFRYSQDPMPPQFKNDDGSQMTHQGYWDKYVAPNLTGTRQEELTDILSEIRSIQRNKNARLNEVKSNREQFIKEATERQTKMQQEWTSRAEAHAKKVLEGFGPEAQAKQVPDKASPEEKAAIEAHNARLLAADKEAKQLSQTIFQSPEVFIEAILHAVRSKAMDAILKEKVARITDLETQLKAKDDELTGIKRSATLTHKVVPVGNKAEKAKPPANQTAGQAMEGHVREYFQERGAVR